MLAWGWRMRGRRVCLLRRRVRWSGLNDMSRTVEMDNKGRGEGLSFVGFSQCWYDDDGFVCLTSEQFYVTGALLGCCDASRVEDVWFFLLYG